VPSDFYKHDLALVEEGAIIGSRSKVWHWCQVRSGARVGEDCILAKGVFIDTGVVIGNKVKIQNNVSIYQGVEIEDGVFVGPHVCFTNDFLPRAVTPDLKLKNAADWKVTKTFVAKGVSIGANSTIVAGVKVAEWSMIGAGSVVTKNVPPYALVYGNPARVRGVISPLGEIISRKYQAGEYKDASGKIIKILPEWCA
jgi:UDP-2-acetamido-3-amino-2,3-dideoxy-glucuronate N-acetyltransferase